MRDVYLLLSLLPLRSFQILVLHGEIGDGASAAAAVSGARVGIGLRQLSLHLRRVRVRALAGEDGEPGGAIDQRGVGGKGEVGVGGGGGGGGGGCGGGEGGQRIGFGTVARRFPGALRRVEEFDGLRRGKLEQRGEGIGGFRRRSSHETLDFLVELNGFESGLLHDPIEPDRTAPDQPNRIGGTVEKMRHKHWNWLLLSS